MTDSRNRYFQWVGFIVFLAIYFIFRPSDIVGMNFHLLLFLCLIIYMAIFKCLHLLKNAFFPRSDEIKTIIIGTLIYSMCFLIIRSLYTIKSGSFFPIFRMSIDILFETFVEELVFRGFLLGMLIEGIQLSKIHLSHVKTLPFYFTGNEKDIVLIVTSLLVTSILFSNFHLDWLFSDPKLLLGRLVFTFSYFGLPFVLTNKKIYASWIIHYFQNLYVMV